jgi:zinc protease
MAMINRPLQLPAIYSGFLSAINRPFFAHCCSLLFVILGLGVFTIAGQEPRPGPPRPINVPSVRESKLSNGLTVAVVEKRDVPLVTVQLLVRSGADSEILEKAGLAGITASMLTKGTKTRSATQIAEQIEFLGGTIFAGSDWNRSFITVSGTSDKIRQIMAIMSDAVLNPTFPQSELDLLKAQSIDGLTYNLTQPGFLTSYAATAFTFDEHPSIGTLASLGSITRADVEAFYKETIRPSNAVLIFGGDISATDAAKISSELFKNWREPVREVRKEIIAELTEATTDEPSKAVPAVGRILVIDLPDSGQASVSYVKKVGAGRESEKNLGASANEFFIASTLNSLLGGGYSSRLNQEIRIKRGLSYGAGSSFTWRSFDSNFATRTQTKNESAAEVAQIVVEEIGRLIDQEISTAELTPRKAVLTGGFSREIETTGGLVRAISDLYSFGIRASELNNYMPGVNAIGEKQIRDFAKSHLRGGDIIIVGDHSLFKDDLAKRFPNIKASVIPVSELDVMMFQRPE